MLVVNVKFTLIVHQIKFVLVFDKNVLRKYQNIFGLFNEISYHVGFDSRSAT